LKNLPCHYGWVVAATGILVLFACIGLGRFGYTVLIPGMEAELHLGYRQFGFIGTSNFFGYLVAVFFAPTVMVFLKPRLTAALGLLLLALSMAAIAGCSSFSAILFCYTLAGLGTGFANIPMMALTSRWFAGSRRGRAAGLVICGNGLGIVFVGFAIPLFDRLFAAQGWRLSWLLLGTISLVVACCAVILLRNDPAELGLQPVGADLAAAAEQAEEFRHRGHSGLLWRIGIPYALFGATFMVYGTFIVTSMVNEYGLSVQSAGRYWSWVGLFSLFSGLAFGTLSDRIGRRYGLITVFAVLAGAYLLAGMKYGIGGLLVSLTLYGLAVFAAPAIVVAAIGDHYPPEQVARAFSNATLLFAFGQTAGPAGAALIAGPEGHFTTAYLVAALLTLFAGLWALSIPAHAPGKPGKG